MAKTSVDQRIVAVLTFLLWLMCPRISLAQQPTATIRSFSGIVLVNGQAATAGAILRGGDALETQAGANIVLTLSDSSELRIGQNTKIDLAQLVQRPDTQARTSRLKLWYGKLQATLSPGHQKKGSSFTIDTPNATAGVKFSHPQIEVSYDPVIKTTIIIGFTVPVTVRNLITREQRKMPAAHRAMIQDLFLWMTPLEPGAMETSSIETSTAATSGEVTSAMITIPSVVQQEYTRRELLLDARQIFGGTASPAPVSAGANRAETSQSPGPAGSPGLSRPWRVTITTQEE